jgi:hypothetical protein
MTPASRTSGQLQSHGAVLEHWPPARPEHNGSGASVAKVCKIETSLDMLMFQPGVTGKTGSLAYLGTPAAAQVASESDNGSAAPWTATSEEAYDAMPATPGLSQISMQHEEAAHAHESAALHAALDGMTPGPVCSSSLNVWRASTPHLQSRCTSAQQLLSHQQHRRFADQPCACADPDRTKAASFEASAAGRAAGLCHATICTDHMKHVPASADNAAKSSRRTFLANLLQRARSPGVADAGLHAQSAEVQAARAHACAASTPDSEGHQAVRWPPLEHAKSRRVQQHCSLEADGQIADCEVAVGCVQRLSQKTMVLHDHGRFGCAGAGGHDIDVDASGEGGSAGGTCGSVLSCRSDPGRAANYRVKLLKGPINTDYSCCN